MSKSLTDDRNQYIEAPRTELYDWREDPGETRNLASGLPPAFRRLRVALSAMGHERARGEIVADLSSWRREVREAAAVAAARSGITPSAVG